MTSFLKSCFLFCLIFCCLQTHAQLFEHHTNASLHHLVATNEKKTRSYVNGDILKIRYHQNGEIIKAKGKLLIDSAGVVEMIPYSNKPVVAILTDSIVSISRWKRKDKMILGIAAGTGVVLTAAAIAASASSSVKGGKNDNVLPLFLLIAISIDAGYVAIATPVVLISEWLSLRSAVDGYHFYIE